ncbi:MAG: 3-oxoacid CoA-transferase subunit B [Bacteroidales bacterium]|jgi:acetate CoA/acetoacetate CoA-transferase beta subunit|nr:3-oxoacid CoA-transferase subunit B [Bacteroidales bacterium]
MDKNQIREIIARRGAYELHDGDVVNLGIGIPTLIPNYLRPGVKVLLQSENGLIGMDADAKEGEIDTELTNAGGGHITKISGAATFCSATSFGLIRGGHVDVTILGAMEVDEKGDLANWMVPGRKVSGMGGAMDLLIGAKRVVLAMEHTAKGTPKIVKQCSLPLTAKGEVDRIITEMGVMDITPEGIMLVEIHPEFSVEQVQAATAATLLISKDLKPMLQ